MRPRAAAIVEAAGDLLDEEGPEALTMRRLAERTGLRASSLYRHLPGKGAIEAALVLATLAELGERTAAAAAAEPADALGAIARAYRAYALERPHRYRLMMANPLPDDPAVADVNRRASAPAVAAVDGDVDRARAAWAFAHGMVDLELAGRFPPGADVDAAWTAGVAALRSGGTARGARRAP